MKRRSLFTMIPAATALLAMRSKGTPNPQPAVTPAGPNWETSLAEIAQCVGYLRPYGKAHA